MTNYLDLKKKLINIDYGVKKKNNIINKNGNKVCLKWLRCNNFSKYFLPHNKKTIFKNYQPKTPEFNYSDYFWTTSINSKTEINSNNFSINQSPKYLFFYQNSVKLEYYDRFFKNYFKNQINYRMSSYGSLVESSVKKKLFKKDYDKFIELSDLGVTGIPINFRCLKRRYLKSKILISSLGKNKSKLRCSKIIEKNKLKKIFYEFKINNLIKKKPIADSSLTRFLNYSNKNTESIYLKNLGGLGFPITYLIKRNQQIRNFTLKTTPYRQYNLTNQFMRHPATTSFQLKRYIANSISFQEFNSFSFNDKRKTSYSLFYSVIWRYFKMKMEGFFYKKLGIRMHIWFLNIWDLFINGINSQWHWFRYENSTVRFLMKKGKQFLIEDRESAKFYVRTMALTITMVGGAKLFMDNVSIMLSNYRNNWAFILSVTRSLRYCINFFWFRFFINYKVTLQGKIGGFLRAAKKVFKKGTITIEDRSSAITYYRGYPVTRFGVYNLSFWIQYRIPTLIGKFEDLEYIDTMKVLLGTYSVPWLAQRLAGIVSAILQDRVYKINIKVAQYDRRIRTRQKLFLDIFNKNSTLISEKNYFNESSLVDSIRKKKIKNLLKINRKTKITKWFNSFFKGKTKKLPNKLKNEIEFMYSFNPAQYLWKMKKFGKKQRINSKSATKSGGYAGMVKIKKSNFKKIKNFK